MAALTVAETARIGQALTRPKCSEFVSVTDRRRAALPRALRTRAPTRVSICGTSHNVPFHDLPALSETADPRASDLSHNGNLRRRIRRSGSIPTAELLGRRRQVLPSEG